jgi:hypothetical protein
VLPFLCGVFWIITDEFAFVISASKLREKRVYLRGKFEATILILKLCYDWQSENRENLMRSGETSTVPFLLL